MKNSIFILFILILTAGFAAGKLFAFSRLGAPPESTVAFGDPPAQTAILEVADPDAALTIESWVQLIEDYQVDRKTLDKATSDAANDYALHIALPEDGLFGSMSFSVLTPVNGTSGGGRGYGLYDSSSTYVGAARTSLEDNSSLEAQDRAEKAFETSTLTLLGLILVLMGLVPRGWRNPPRSRSAFSRRHARIRVLGESPLAGYAVPVAFRRARSAQETRTG